MTFEPKAQNVTTGPRRQVDEGSLVLDLLLEFLKSLIMDCLSVVKETEARSLVMIVAPLGHLVS